MYTFRFGLAVLGCLAGLSAQAKEKETGKSKEDSLIPPAQVTFIYPMGTNGYEAYDQENRFSLNILAGVNGDVSGVELGGFANVTNGEVKGIQAAGFANVVKKEAQGVQVAGFTNVVKGNITGTQVAGFANLSMDSLHAVQAAGFANVAIGEVKGSQLAGFGNVALDSLKGLQAAGFANAAHNNVEGVQAAGFMNVTHGRVEGVQVSGFINVAEKLRGSQVGFINLVDSLEEGTPIGFLSLVGNGYNHLEIGGNELLQAQASAKLGTTHFYNIFGLGIGWPDQQRTYGLSYGIGTILSPEGKSFMAIEGRGISLGSEGSSWKDLSFVGRLDILFYQRLGGNTSLYFGPSFNAQVRRVEDDGVIRGVDASPYSFGENTYDEANVKYWAGFNLGIQF